MSNTAPCNPIELAYAVAALQSGESTASLLSAVPQSLDDHDSKTSIRSCSTKQAAGSGSNEELELEETPRSTTPELFNMKDDDTDRRLARSRERNREHARRTRLRKKAHLEALQSKVKGLEAERQVLKQSLEECGIASILLGLSSGDHEAAKSVNIDNSENNEAPSQMAALLAAGKRKRFLSETMPEKPLAAVQPLTLNIDGEVTSIGGGKSHINWKTGMYRDDNGNQKQLTPEQLENLRCVLTDKIHEFLSNDTLTRMFVPYRRERNRMHAKMTRDRKKCFIATIEKTIDDLEKENNRMRSVLSKMSASKFSQFVTPMTSPNLTATEAPHITDDGSEFSQEVDSEDDTRESKRNCHGFSLDR